MEDREELAQRATADDETPTTAAPSAPAQEAGTGTAPAAHPERQEEEREPQVAALLAELREARKEAAAYRRRLRESEQLTAQERERLQQELAARDERIAQLEAELLVARREAQERALHGAVLAAATRRGALYPDLVWRALDLTRVEFAEDGTPRNLEALLDELAERYPALFAGSPRTSPANPERRPSDRTAVIRRSDLIDRAFWERHRDEILRAYREGRIVNE